MSTGSPPAARKQRAEALFRPMRLRILAELAAPDTAAGVARRLAVPRQKVNYHLRELEREGMVELVEERKSGNCLERLVRATARSYLVSAEALGALAADPESIGDRFSSAYLVAVAARAIRELAELRQRAEQAGQRLATFTVETEVRFASAQERKRFLEELATAVAQLVGRYHHAAAPGGRSFRILLGAYPALERESPGDTAKEPT
jgi:DNA-binding transcriptional ArsR family regulator